MNSRAKNISSKVYEFVKTLKHYMCGPTLTIHNHHVLAPRRSVVKMCQYVTAMVSLVVDGLCRV